MYLKEAVFEKFEFRTFIFIKKKIIPKILIKIFIYIKAVNELYIKIFDIKHK